jgi:hypothetical protein
MTNRILLVLLFAPILAGCGSNQPAVTTGASAKGGSNNDVSAAYAYARCMRSSGVPNFPDPKVSIGPGHSSIAFAVNPSETGSPKFNTAQKTCSKILPAPQSRSQQQAQQQADRRNLLAFASCMRTKGIQAFPDPNSQGQLRLPTVAAAGVDIHSRQFLNAAVSCAGVTHGQITAAQIRQGLNGTQ